MSLGGGRSRRVARRPPWAARAGRRVARGRRDDRAPTCSTHGVSRRAASSRSTTSRTSSMRRCSSSRSSASSRRRTSASGRPCSPSSGTSRPAGSCFAGARAPTEPVVGESVTVCSWWLVAALAMIGEVDRARGLAERLLAYSSKPRALRGAPRSRVGPPARQLPARAHAPGAHRRAAASDPRGRVVAQRQRFDPAPTGRFVCAGGRGPGQSLELEPRLGTFTIRRHLG